MKHSQDLDAEIESKKNIILDLFSQSQESSYDEIITRIDEIAPNSSDETLYCLLYIKGIILSQQNKHEMALSCFNTILEIHKDNNVQYYQSTTFYILGRYAEAIDSFLKIPKDYKDYALVLQKIGDSFLAQGNLYDAIQYYNQIKPEDSVYRSVQHCKGTALIKLDQFEEAIECLGKVHKESVNYSQAKFNQAYASFRYGEFQSTIDCSGKISKDDKYYPDGLFLKVSALQALCRNNEALEVLDEIILFGTDRDRDRALFTKATLLACTLERHREAIECCDKITDTDENYYIGSLFLQATSYKALYRYEEAVKSYDRILEKDPNQVKARYEKSLALHSLNRDEDALECLNEISIEKQDPLYYDVELQKGIVLFDNKNPIAALSHFITVVKNTTGYNFNCASLYSGYLLEDLNNDGLNNEAINDAINSLEERPLALAKKMYEQVSMDSMFYTHAQFALGRLFFQENDCIKSSMHFINSKKTDLYIIKALGRIDNNIENIKSIFYKILEQNTNSFFDEILTECGNVLESDRMEYKEVYFKSLLIISNLLLTGSERQVAHYTTKTTAGHLLFNQSKFRLSLATVANDPEEGITLLKYLFKEKYVSNESENYKAFIGCFTFNHNNLNQFRLYGKEDAKEATGASIVVDEDFFANEAKLNVLDSSNSREKSNKYALFRCVYIDHITKEVVSLGHQDGAGHDLEDKRRKINDELIAMSKFILDKNLKNEIISRLLLPLRYLIKNSAFKEEQECRIFSIENLGNKGITITPDFTNMYIESVTLQGSMIKKVIFAPKSNGYEMFKTISTHTQKNIEFVLSELPFI